jgi:hypothetical protein
MASDWAEALRRAKSMEGTSLFPKVSWGRIPSDKAGIFDPGITSWGLLPPPPCFSKELILKGDKVLCFDTLLKVLILKVVRLHQNCAKFPASWEREGALESPRELRETWVKVQGKVAGAKGPAGNRAERGAIEMAGVQFMRKCITVLANCQYKLRIKYHSNGFGIGNGRFDRR